MSVLFQVKVFPASGRQELLWCDKQQLLRCFVKSTPERSRANDELIALLAKQLGITKQEVCIVAGHAGRRKKIAVSSLQSLDTVLGLLGIVRQQNIV